jgi:phosphohistidine swiveling domain-containing protein
MRLEKIYEDHNTDLFPFYLYIDYWVYLPGELKQNITQKVILFKEGTANYYVDSAEYAKVHEYAYEYIFKQDGIKKIGEVIEKDCKKLLEMSKKMKITNYKEKSNAQILEEYRAYHEIFAELNNWAMIYGAMEFGKEALSSRGLKEALLEGAKTPELKNKVEEAFGTLTALGKETFVRQERRDTLKFALVIEKGNDRSLFDRDVETIKMKLEALPELELKFEKLKHDYEWINYGYSGPAMDLEYYIGTVKQVLEIGDVKRQLNEFEGEMGELAKKQRKLEAEFGLSEEIRRRFAIIRELSYQKFYRKEVSFCAFHAIEGLQKEVARRFGLSLIQLRYFAYDEVMVALKGKGKLDANVANERLRGCIYHFLDGKHEIFCGKGMEKWLKLLPKEEKLGEISELKGDCASPGKVRGIVRIVMNAKDIGKVKEGDILVSFSTNPQMVPGMKKAGAIVTDQGGITCHAAIVSRELKIPCIIGTKIATKALKDGELVEVDATNGIVRKIK